MRKRLFRVSRDALNLYTLACIQEMRHLGRSHYLFARVVCNRLRHFDRIYVADLP